MHLSAVVPATDGAATLDRCLAAIAAAAEPPEELVVVRGPDMAPAHGAGIVSVRSPAFGGPAAARNAGAAMASGDIVVFVDADVAVRPDVFARMRERFAADASLDAVFGSYCDHPGAPGLVSGFRNLLHHHVHQRGAGPAETFWTGLGAIRREVLLAAGGLDDGLRYLEDLELGRRLRDHGATIVLDPAIQGTHLKGYDLAAMVRTDLVERAVPWVRLALEGRASRSALNAGGRHRASAAAALAAAGGIALRRPRAAGGGAAALIGLNAGFYRLLARRLGWRGALLGPPLHVLHHLTALCGVPAGVVQHVLGAPRERRVVSPAVLRAALDRPLTSVPATPPEHAPLTPPTPLPVAPQAAGGNAAPPPADPSATRVRRR